MHLGDLSLFLLPVLTALTIATTTATGASPSREELAAGKQWTMAHLGSGKAALPFSFVYGGKSSSELLAQWEFKTGSRELDEMRTERTLTWSDPRSRLTVRCVAIEYDDFPAVEWTLYFKNEGNGRSPLLKDIQALDAQFEREQGDGPAGTPAFVLHGAQAPLGLDIGGLTSGTSHDRSNTLSYPPASGCGRWESGLATVPH